MKKFKMKNLIILTTSFVLGLSGPMAAFAATAPSLGDASSFSVLGAAAMSSANTTTVSGNLGLSPGLAASKTGTWTVGGSEFFGTGGLSASAQTAALGAYNNLVAQTSSGVWSTNPNGINSPLPGVWTETASPVYSGTLTLNGGYNDVWVFKLSTDFTFSGSVVLAGNAQACNVFWSVSGDTTLASGSNFVGTLIGQNDITSASGATINGRLISLSGTTIAMNGSNSSITGPTCATAPAPASSGGSSSLREGMINVVKLVINDNGGTKTVTDFPLFVNNIPVVSGATNAFPAPSASGGYLVTETNNSNYTRTFSGDCTFDGHISLSPNDNRFCILTNDDIGAPLIPPVPPLINVVKVPSPLALPAGPGPVTYTYTLYNVGTVPVTNITMVGDTCSPITFTSGDINGNSKLDITEVWTYRCSTTLSKTHTNIVTATGWANGITAVDIANATVVVGASVVPPLIHVTKIPSPLALSAAGGMVTYTQKVTNPGTVALSNVRISDDKCSPLTYISGDINGNSKLDTNETWMYLCQMNLAKTTTNTVIATGDANGLTAKDLAIVTVIVAGPSLPNTGFSPEWNNVLLAGIIILVLASLTAFIKKRKKLI